MNDQRPPRIRPYSYPVAQWVERYQAGASIIRIAMDDGISGDTVRRYLNMAGLTLRGKKS